jgi:uncharacterized protein YecT (DUF1311 family)
MKTNSFNTLTKSLCLILFVLTQTANAVEYQAALIEWWQNSQSVEAQCPGYYYSEATEFYCSAQAYLDYEKLQTISNLSVFVQGPHTEKTLELNNPYSFGYYNKDFIKWLRESVLPLTTTPAFKELFKFFYNHSIKRIAQTYYIVHERLFANPLYVVREQQTYLRFLKTEGIPSGYGYEYTHFAGLHEQGFNESTVKEAVLFWIRRITDDTETEFFQSLKTALEIYDADFLAEFKKETECDAPKEVAKQLACKRQAAEQNMVVLENELEMVYRKLYAKLNAEGQQKLEKAHHAWQQFRDSHLAFFVDTVDEQVKPIRRLEEKAKMTKERIKVLTSK